MQVLLVYCILFVAKIYRIQLTMSVKCVQSVASALNLSRDIIHLKEGAQLSDSSDEENKYRFQRPLSLFFAQHLFVDGCR